MPASSFIHPVHQVEVKLGRTYARRTALSRMKAGALHDFLAVLPDDFAPVDYDNTSGIENWGMMLNDSLGDCTIAAPGHMEQAWTAASGSEYTIPDAEILKAYSDFDGYVVGDPSTDQGGDILTVCQDWKAKGIGGKFISDFAEVNMTQMRWQQALAVFGALNVGVAFPDDFASQIGGTLDFDSSKPILPPNPYNGHDMAAVGYTLEGVCFVTWGLLQWATWRWVMQYANECMACLSPEWKKAPVPLDQLSLILQQMEH